MTTQFLCQKLYFITNEYKLCINEVLCSSVICCVTFYSFGFLNDPPPSSQINHVQRLILSYRCPAKLDLFLDRFPYLMFSQLPFASGLLYFSISSFSMTGCVTGQQTLISYSPCSLVAPLFIFSVSPACDCSCLAIGHSALYQTIRCLDSQSITVSHI